VTRNNPAPVLVRAAGHLHHLHEESTPVGIYRGTRPVVTELPLETGMTVIMFTDGMVHAGARYGRKLDLETTLQALCATGEEDEDEDDTPLSPSAETIAEALLQEALRLDEGRPTDDISVVVLQVVPHREEPRIRRMLVRLPL
jgi:serine phosphatase RsbU (regulator of sigma subunit)